MASIADVRPKPDTSNGYDSSNFRCYRCGCPYPMEKPNALWVHLEFCEKNEQAHCRVALQWKRNGFVSGLGAGIVLALVFVATILFALGPVAR